MESLKASTAAICAVSAVIFIVDGLVSGTRLKNGMKTLLNLVLLTAAIAPFAKGSLEFALPDIPDAAEYSYEAAEVYKDELRRRTSYNISEVLLRQINSAGIVCYRIETDVHILEDGGVLINKVSIQASDFDKAAEIVKNSLGKETEVVSYDD